MLTLEKVSKYKEYQGYYDGFYIQNKELAEKIVTGDEWALITSLVQDVFLVKRGLASKGFEEKLGVKLREVCDSEETISQLIELEEFMKNDE